MPLCSCEYKGKKESLTPDELEFNLVLQEYRARVEHVIGEPKKRLGIFKRKWAGNFALAAATTRIAMHMSALEERMKGPRYDCFGPWPMYPDAEMHL